MRRFVIRVLYTLLLIMFITSTPIIVVNPSNGNGETESAISLLQQFCGNVSALPDEAFEDARLAEVKKNELCNKVEAVIHQVGAGAYEGALNKLINDVKKAITSCIADEWEAYLLSLIDHIIDIIKGTCCVDVTPPTIHTIYQYPKEPEYEDSVLVLAHVTDCQSGVANVTLSYWVNSGEKINITMSKTDGLFTGEIPAQPYNSTVSYLICAYDKAGNVAISSEYSYVVGDYHPPFISYIERVPASPNYNETVLVLANATEPPFASGVKEIILTYNNGTAWTNVTMSSTDTLYSAEIPQLPYGTIVQYRVYAVDYAGNWAAMDIYSYSVGDRFLPVARIIDPVEGSYLSMNVTVETYVFDDNFYKAELTANGTLLDSWAETGPHHYLWDISANDGVYILKLEAHDIAGNIAEHIISVVVDNTPPMAIIQLPLNGSYVKGIVSVQVSAEDANFKEMVLKLGDFVQVWEIGGDQTYLWNTSDFNDGSYVIDLTAYDKAGNEAEDSVFVIVDNAAPFIDNITWTPAQPIVNETVDVSAQVFEVGSGIANVTLWFKIDQGEYESLNMTLQGDRWTCTILGQNANVTVRFYVECYDNAGNRAATLERSYTVEAAAPGFPLYWLLAIIAFIVAALAISVYFLRKRGGSSSV